MLESLLKDAMGLNDAIYCINVPSLVSIYVSMSSHCTAHAPRHTRMKGRTSMCERKDVLSKNVRECSPPQTSTLLGPATQPSGEAEAKMAVRWLTMAGYPQLSVVEGGWAGLVWLGRPAIHRFHCPKGSGAALYRGMWQGLRPDSMAAGALSLSPAFPVCVQHNRTAVSARPACQSVGYKSTQLFARCHVEVYGIHPYSLP